MWGAADEWRRRRGGVQGPEAAARQPQQGATAAGSSQRGRKHQGGALSLRRRGRGRRGETLGGKQSRFSVAEIRTSGTCRGREDREGSSSDRAAVGSVAGDAARSSGGVGRANHGGAEGLDYEVLRGADAEESRRVVHTGGGRGADYEGQKRAEEGSEAGDESCGSSVGMGGAQEAAGAYHRGGVAPGVGRSSHPSGAVGAASAGDYRVDHGGEAADHH